MVLKTFFQPLIITHLSASIKKTKKVLLQGHIGLTKCILDDSIFANENIFANAKFRPEINMC